MYVCIYVCCMGARAHVQESPLTPICMARGCGQNSVSTGTSMSCFDYRESNCEYRCRAEIIENRTSNIDVVTRSTRIDVVLRSLRIEQRIEQKRIDTHKLRVRLPKVTCLINHSTCTTTKSTLRIYVNMDEPDKVQQAIDLLSSITSSASSQSSGQGGTSVSGSHVVGQPSSRVGSQNQPPRGGKDCM